MNRLRYLLFAAVVITVNVSAQQVREVVVTRNYQPDISKFGKLDFMPREIDTVALQPDIDYFIVPKPIALPMPVNVVAAERVDIAHRVLRYPFYLRAGGGIRPLRSLLDFYTTAEVGKSIFGAYLNHNGTFSSPTNDAGVRRSTMTMQNAARGYFTHNSGAHKFEASLNYRHNLYEPYGQFTPVYVAAASPAAHTLQYGEVSAQVGYRLSTSTFSVSEGRATRMSTLPNGESVESISNSMFGYSFHGEGGYFFSAAGGKAGFVDLKGDVRFGKLGIGTLNIELPISYESGTKADFRVGIVPAYRLKLFETVNLNAGAQILYNYHKELANSLYFYPIVEANVAVGEAFKPYVSWTGELGRGTLRSLVSRNPYLATKDEIFAKNPSLNRLKAGFSGNSVKRLTYDIFGGMDLWRNYIYFTAQPSGLFAAKNVSVVNNYYIGAAFIAKPFADAEFSADGRYNFFDPLPQAGIAMPRWQAGIKASYNYRNRYYAHIGANFLGKREFATVDDITGEGIDTVPVSIDLSAQFEARISQSINVFVSGDNLLNRRYELYDHYFIPGMSVMAGVKIVF